MAGSGQAGIASNAEWHANAFGLHWRADAPLAALRPRRESTGLPDVTVRRVEALPARVGGERFNRGWLYADGVRFDHEDDGLAFDMVGGSAFHYCAGPHWQGRFPDSLYGTLAGLVLAWRGSLAFHASAVVVDGRAVLIAGRGGAGKSTLAAGLAVLGGTFIADDLVAVDRSGADRFHVSPGRARARLHPAVAAWWGRPSEPDPADPRGKLRVAIDGGDGLAAWPLAAIIVLAEDTPAAHPVPLLAQHLYRPRWQQRLPGADVRATALLALARHVPVRTLAPAEMRSEAALLTQARLALALAQTG